MFIDYYALLNIPIAASDSDIKKAFREQANVWHPDRNPGKDTTARMQALNEANLILRDSEARERYNAEYLRFNQYKQGYDQTKASSANAAQDEANRKSEADLKTKKEAEENTKKRAEQKAKETAEETTRKKREEQEAKSKHQEKQQSHTYPDPEPNYVYAEYQVQDDLLDRWMRNAKKQAVDLAKQTAADIRGVSGAAAEGCIGGIGKIIIWFVLANIIFILYKACNK